MIFKVHNHLLICKLPATTNQQLNTPLWLDIFVSYKVRSLTQFFAGFLIKCYGLSGGNLINKIFLIV